MTLQNLLRIGRIKKYEAMPAEVQRLLAAIDRNLEDAYKRNISDETRFDVAYKVVMQCALVAIYAARFRPATNEPGHHQTMIQSLPLTLGVDKDVWVVQDALRKRRNANDCTGDLITSAAVAECIDQAKALRQRLNQHLVRARPDLLEAPE